MMVAKKKKGPEEKNTDTPGSTRSLREEAEEILARSPKHSPDLAGQTPDELIHELEVHQVELETTTEELRRAHIALGESRNKFLDLYDFAPTGYLTLNDQALVTEANLACATLLGVDRSKMIRARFRKFVTQKDSDQWVLYFMNALNRDGKQTCTLMLIREDGSVFPARLEGGRLTGSDGAITVRIAISDITDIWQIEALRESEEKFRLISESSPDHIFIQNRDLRYIWVLNPQMGLKPEDMIGKTDYDILSKEDADLVTTVKRRILETGKAIPYETSLSSSRGETDYFEGVYLPKYDNERRINGVMGYFRNITGRKRAEETIRQSEEKFRLVVENDPDAIFIQTEGQFAYVNPAACRLFGAKSADLLVGKPVLDRFHPDFREIVKERIRVLNDELQPVAKIEEMYLRLDGTPFDVEVSAVPMTYLQKDGALVFFNDITERKQSEQTIRDALAEKEVLLREVHHRVKNNLAGIISLIGLQASSVTDPDTISLLTDLETRIRSMALVHESLYRTKDLARVNVAGYTENLTGHLIQVYRTGNNIRCRIEMEEITMPIETAIPCGLVMTEIVTNSLKYAFPATFSCQEIRGEPCTIALTLQRDGSDYLLGVADNGIGMPEGTDVTMHHSFGLYLIRLIVEHQLRGSLEISTAGGTAYTIRFPEPEAKERNPDE